MIFRFVTFTAALCLMASNASAQAISARGIDRATSNQRLENEFRPYTTAQKAVDATQDSERDAITQRVTDLETILAVIQSNVAALAGGNAVTNTATTEAADGLDTDSLPVARSGNGLVSASCPTGYRFTGTFEAPPLSGCGMDTIDTNAVGARRIVCPGTFAALTIYCAR